MQGHFIAHGCQIRPFSNNRFQPWFFIAPSWLLICHVFLYVGHSEDGMWECFLPHLVQYCAQGVSSREGSKPSKTSILANLQLHVLCVPSWLLNTACGYAFFHIWFNIAFRGSHRVRGQKAYFGQLPASYFIRSKPTFDMPPVSICWP